MGSWHGKAYIYRDDIASWIDSQYQEKAGVEGGVHFPPSLALREQTKDTITDTQASL